MEPRTTTTTTKRSFDRELGDLKAKLLHMGEVAEAMIDKSVTALVGRDERASAQVPELESELNRLQIEVDEEALLLLATRQPVARDLRFLASVMKINNDLERIGDLAVNVTQSAAVLAREAPIKPPVDVGRMAELTRGMLRGCLQAFVSGDALAAQRVIDTDDKVDALKYEAVREMVRFMKADPASIEQGLAVVLTAHRLERVADHATNIAEDVIYMTQGRDVRHPKTQRKGRNAGEGRQ